MTRLIVIYNKFDIITVPFPFTERDKKKLRPALVISNKEYQEVNKHIVLLMITSAKHSAWKYDIPITFSEMTGLKAASVIRFKIFSVDERIIVKKIGVLSLIDSEKVEEAIRNLLLI